MTISLYDKQGSAPLDRLDVATYSVDSYSESAISFECNTDCTVAFLPHKRIYLSEVRIYDGDMTLDDIKALADGQPSSPSSSDTAPVIVSGITATSYTFTDLPAGTYSVSVSATYNDLTSDWSLPLTVVVPGQPTSINRPLGADSRQHRIFSADGRYVGDDTSRLGHGVYVSGGKKILR